MKSKSIQFQEFIVPPPNWVATNYLEPRKLFFLRSGTDCKKAMSCLQLVLDSGKSQLHRF